MASIVDKGVKFHERVQEVSQLTGWSYKRSMDEMRRAKRENGLNSAQFIAKLSRELKGSDSDSIKKDKELPKYESDCFVYELFTEEDSSDSKFARILSCSSEDSSIEVPDKLDGFVVRMIRGGAFRSSNFRRIVLPDSITFIGAEAFKDCPSLEYVKLPLDLQVIQRSSFENCESLIEVVLPYGLKRIAKGAFRNCPELKSLNHFMKRGISATMTVDYDLVERNLPSGLDYIGESAFDGCASLTDVHIPFGVQAIPANAYRGCRQLHLVQLHNALVSIGSSAFSDCDSLRCVRLPKGLERLASDAFDRHTALVYDADACEAVANVLAEFPSSRQVCSDALKISSIEDSLAANASFYSPDELQEAVEAYELRNCAPRVDQSVSSDRSDMPLPSRFVRDGEKYVQLISETASAGQVRILLTGDLMCRPRQQATAFDEGSASFDFSYSFEAISNLLKQSDITVGNLESMVAPSFALSKDTDFVDDRAYLNAPQEYLTSVRNAGFDVVMNAQNHAYDVGTQGVFETLDSMNRANLIHCGIYASEQDSHFVLIEANGIKVGFVAFLDQARQRMKRASFTERGLETLFSPFEESRIKQDIAAVKAAGAEFVIAYCHWGREYTSAISNRQARFAQMVADAGADYLFGSHSHCLQPYSVILSADGREVPVLYSGGNFLSDMNIYMPYNADTLVAELILHRDSDGVVHLQGEGYHPCQIVYKRNARGYAQVVPISEMYANADIDSTIGLDESILRIKHALGTLPRFKCLDDGMFNLGLLSESNPQTASKYDLYKLGDSLVAPNQQISGEVGNAVLNARYQSSDGSSNYIDTKPAGVREAVIVCAGQIMYDDTIEKNASIFGSYEFAKSFRGIAKCLQDADFAIGNLTAMVANSYPSMRVFANERDIRRQYCNARAEYIAALHNAGFDAFAMAHYFNACAGLKGIEETEQALDDCGIIYSGLGEHSDPVVEINGIKVAFLSFAMNCVGWRNTMTSEGADVLLRLFDSEQCAARIAEARARGAESVITYINCGIVGSPFNLARRSEIAEQAAEAGSDYVICTMPYIVSKYYRYTTASGKKVPIATSLGSFISGHSKHADYNSAMLQITLRRTFTGEIEVSDNFIPLKVFSEFGGANNVVLPASKYFNPSYRVSDFQNVKTDLGKKLGDSIAQNIQRTTYVHSKNTNLFTLEEVYGILGAEPSEKDLIFFGDRYSEKASGFASRRGDLTPGCVAFLFKHINYQDAKILIRPSDLIDNDVALVIATEQHSSLPTIVVKDVATAFFTLTKAARNRFHPLTVAVTGSVGKTTTKDFIKGIFSTHLRTLCVHGNNNTLSTIPLVIQKLSEDDEAYIQEVHGGSPNAAKNSSKILKPDIAIITAITASHLGQMGSMEAVVQGKMDIAAGLSENGVLVLNNDNSYLASQNPSVRTCRYSMSDDTCDFYATDINVGSESSTFTLVSRGGEFAEAGEYKAKINIQGAHNIQNAVGAFAVASIAGIPPHKIVAALARYRTEGDRQNLVDVNGARFLIDVYSTSQLSALTAVDTLVKLPVEDGGRKIAVLGDLTDLGDDSERIHVETGKQLAQKDFDVLMCYGEESLPLVRAMREEGREAYYFRNRDTFNAALKNLIRPKDVVLFKASSRFDFKGATISPLYGNISK